MAMPPGANQRSYYVGRHREMLGESTAEISPAPRSPLPRRLPQLPPISGIETLHLPAETIAAVRSVVEAHR